MIRSVRSRASFVRLSREGQRRQSKYCWVRYVPGKTALPAETDPARDPKVPDHPQIGYAIGRSVGGAVVRNRIRRRLRAILDEYRDELAPGLYLIGVRNPAAAHVLYSELRTDVRLLLDGVFGAPRSSGQDRT